MTGALSPMAATHSSISARCHVGGSDLPEVGAFGASARRTVLRCNDEPIPVFRQLGIVNRPPIFYVDTAGGPPVSCNLTRLGIQHAAALSYCVRHRVDSGSLVSAVRERHTKHDVSGTYASHALPRYRKAHGETVVRTCEIKYRLSRREAGSVAEIVLTDECVTIYIQDVWVDATPRAAVG